MRMKQLIERCEREQLDEVDPQTLFKLGYGVAGALLTSPAWAPIAKKVAGAAANSLADKLPKRQGKLSTMVANREAERCHKRGGKDCLCAKGFHYDKSSGKCVKNTLGSGMKRLFNK